VNQRIETAARERLDRVPEVLAHRLLRVSAVNTLKSDSFRHEFRSNKHCSDEIGASLTHTALNLNGGL
jgi:hypothetical protein